MKSEGKFEMGKPGVSGALTFLSEKQITSIFLRHFFQLEIECVVLYLLLSRFITPHLSEWLADLIIVGVVTFVSAAHFWSLARKYVAQLKMHAETKGTLAHERNLLRILIDNAPDCVYIKDASSRFLVANHTVARHMGAKTTEDLLGKNDFDFYPAPLAKTYYDDEQALLHSGAPLLNHEEVSIDAEGNSRCILSTKVPFRDDFGKVAGLVGIGRDITERKAAEVEYRRAKEALSRERNLLRTLIDNVPDCIYVKDTSSRFLVANRTLTQIVGANRIEDLLGKTDFDFFPENMARGYYDDEQKLIQSGQALLNREEATVDTQGNSKWLLTTKVPFRDESGKVVGLVGIGRDITKRKTNELAMQKARELAEEASRAKSEFLANMSHEIRTPLNGIIGMTELALDTELSLEQREYMEMVKNSGESLLIVINDILDFSKIEAGKLDFDCTDFDLRDCLEESLRALALKAHQKGLELLCDIHPDCPQVVRGDPSRLRQIVVNLVGNAIKFTERGEVTITAENMSTKNGVFTLNFAVADTGVGIPPEKQKLIFEPFSQADTSTTRKFGGTGLGLTISNRLVQMMNGKMWVESEPGQGAKFHFTAQLEVGSKALEAPQLSPVELRDIRVLVVDDNRTNLRILERALARWEMKPKVVERGSEALKYLSEAREAGQPYDLVVTDYFMPEMDGFSLVEQIRQKQEFAELPIIMLTSAGQHGDAARCRELGITVYLAKPVRQWQLRDAMAKALSSQPKQTEPATLLTRHSLRQVPITAMSLNVLLAEDNLVNQKLMTRLLEKRGHKVTLANTGREALNALDRSSYDLVFMDIQMPEMDGFEATAAIREKERKSGAHQEIIALTAHAMKDDKERCLDAGMDAYLSKPVQAQKLDEVLDQCVLSRMKPTKAFHATSGI